MTAVPDQNIPTWTLGDRMRKAMEASGHTPGTMAEIYRMSRTSVSNWIHDRVTPDHRTITMWANITGVPVWWIENGDTPPAPIAQLAELRTFNPKCAPSRHLALVAA